MAWASVSIIPILDSVSRRKSQPALELTFAALKSASTFFPENSLKASFDLYVCSCRFSEKVCYIFP